MKRVRDTLKLKNTVGGEEGMRTTVKSAVLAFLLTLPGIAFALGLGGVEVNSGLNEPLDARIPVTATDEELSSASVILASGRDFERVGLSRSSMLEFLSIRLVTSGPEPYVSVTSSDPISDPFMSFLLDVNWANGRMLREYTLLLDPPVYAPSSSVTPAPSVSGYEDDAPVEMVDDTAATATDQTDSVATPSTSADSSTADDSYVSYQTSSEYGPVSSGETLWEIARDVRPERSLSINQTMVALLRANPEAFIDNNINNLRRGSVLRVPDAAEIRRITLAEAMDTVRTQNAMWQDYRQALSRSAPTVSEPSSSSYTATSSTTSRDDDSRLELVPPRAGEDSGSDVAALRAGGTSETLTRLREVQDELARTQEELAASEAEGSELNSRVNDLESVVDKLQRALNLREDELAALQGQLAQSRESGDTDAGISDLVDAGSDVATDDPFASDSMASTTAPSTTEDTVDDAGVDTPADDQAGSTDQLVDDILTDLGSQAGDSETDAGMQDDSVAADDAMADTGMADTDSGSDLDQGSEPEDASADPSSQEDSSPAGLPQRPDRPWWHMFTSPLVLGAIGLLLVIAIIAFVLMRRGGGDGGREHDTLISGMVKKKGGAPEISGDISDNASNEISDEISAMDQDFEGDFPEVMDDVALTAAIAKDPDNPNLHLQLAKYFFANGQDDRFLDAAENMHAQVGADNDAWQEVSELGAQIMPENPLFATAATSSETTVLPNLDSSSDDQDDELDPFEFESEEVAQADEDEDEDEFPTLEIEDLEASLEDDSTESDDGGIDFDFEGEDTTSAETIEREPIGATDDSADEDASDDTNDDDESPFAGESLSLDDSDDEQASDNDFGLSLESSDEGDSDDDGFEFEMGDRRAVNAETTQEDDALDLADDGPDQVQEDRGDVLDEAEELLANLDSDEDENAASERPTDSAEVTGQHSSANVPTSEIDLDLDDDDLFGNEDPVTTKLDLAKAYVDMGDPEGARNMLQEVVSEGNDDQQGEAKKMLDDLSDD